MKNLLKNAIASAIVIASCYNCSVESIENNNQENLLVIENSFSVEDVQNVCEGQNPQARITNNGTAPVSLEIAIMDGSIIHSIENLLPGDASPYVTFNPDDIIFNVKKSISGVGDEKVVHSMGTCMTYDMEVGADNYLIPSAPESL